MTFQSTIRGIAFEDVVAFAGDLSEEEALHECCHLLGHLLLHIPEDGSPYVCPHGPLRYEVEATLVAESLLRPVAPALPGVLRLRP